MSEPKISRPMKLDEAITHCLQKAQACTACCEEHRQLAAWLSELKKFMEKKSEADKLIAELEERIDDGDRDFEMMYHQNENLLKIVRHHKYRRCLAMARIAQDDYEVHRTFYDMGHQEFELKAMRKYDERREIWLKLANKFKEAMG